MIRDDERRGERAETVHPDDRRRALEAWEHAFHTGAEYRIEYRVRNASLPEGEHTLPRSGLLYFYYRGKTKNIHSVDLFYNGPLGKATLKLLP